MVEGRSVHEERAREWTKATSSGLAGGNNRSRGFESSPTNSHKLVFSGARECGKRGTLAKREKEEGRREGGGGEERSRARESKSVEAGASRGDDFTR